jgi:hypothetical protein
MQPYLWVKPNSDEHKEARKQCSLTCGDYASAVNCVDAYQSRKKVFRIKMTGNKEQSQYQQYLLDHGDSMEPIAIDELLKSEKIMVYLRPTFFIDGSICAELGGSPDGVVVTSSNSILLLEVKCPAEKVPLQVEDVPVRYILQVMGYMHASNLYQTLLMFFNPQFEPVYFRVKYDAELWEEIESLLCEFCEFLKTSTPPPSPAKKTFKELLKKEVISQYVQQITLNEL